MQKYLIISNLSSLVRSLITQTQSSPFDLYIAILECCWLSIYPQIFLDN